MSEQVNRREIVLGMLAVSAVAAKPAEAGTLKTQINGATINYSIAGQQNGHPMVVLHGGRGYGTHPSVFKTYLPPQLNPPANRLRYARTWIFQPDWTIYI